MKYYAGLDVSLEETHIAIVDQEGEIHANLKVATDPKAIAKVLTKSGFAFEKVGLESGSLSRWLVKGLSRFPVVCIDARSIAPILDLKVNKTDENDAVGIAGVMLSNSYRLAHIKSDERVAHGAVLAGRRRLVQQRQQLINHLRGELKLEGIKLGPVSKSKITARIRAFLHVLPEFLQLAFEAQCHVIDVLNEQIAKLEGQIRAIIQENKEAQLLMTTPGVGSITALTYLCAVDDPHRFRRSKSVGAYFGLTPTQYSSGRIHYQGRISKRGNPEVRSLLVEAGVVILTRTKSWSRLKAWGNRLQKKKGTKKAAAAVGRKLGIILHQMLITQKPFCYGEPRK